VGNPRLRQLAETGIDAVHHRTFIDDVLYHALRSQNAFARFGRKRQADLITIDTAQIGKRYLARR